MKHNMLVAGLLAGSLGLFGAGAGYAAAGTHTAQALEHAQAAAKENLLEDIQEHAQVSLTHVKAAEEAKEAGAEHLRRRQEITFTTSCATCEVAY